MSKNNNKLKNVSIILCNTSHAGNIGSTARAMKTMGITNLILVSPISKPDDHTMALATNARDIVESAKIFTTLDEAIQSMTLAVALSSRKREFSEHIFTPAEITPQIITHINQNEKIGFVFGSEKNGLTIAQLEKCNRLVTILGNPNYFSLNLSQAVQIMCYELYKQFTELDILTESSNAINQQPLLTNNLSSHKYNTLKQVNSSKNQLATVADTQGVLNHLDQILVQVNYYKNKNKSQVKRNLQHIINKAALKRNEVDLIRGILNKINTNIIKT